MSPSDFNPWGMGSSGKSRSVFFSQCTSITAEMVLVMFLAWKVNVWLVLGKVKFALYFWSTGKFQSFQPALDLKLKFLVWGNLAHFAIMGWFPWARLHCRASLQAWAPWEVLQGHQAGVICPNPLFIRCWGVFIRCSAKICWYLQHKRCFVFLLLAGPRVSFFFFFWQMRIF